MIDALNLFRHRVHAGHLVPLNGKTHRRDQTNVSSAYYADFHERASRPYQRAVRCLREHGIVETEQHKSKFHSGMSVTFLRPIYYLAAGPLLFEPQQEEAA